MKKQLIIFISAIALFAASGCSGNDEESEPVQETASTVVSVESMEEISVVSQEEKSEVVSTLPDGVKEDKKGYLKYTDSGKSITAIFPDSFSVLDSEYTPENGIYLQNADGTATLQIESVKNEGIARNDLSEYLKETYPDADVYISDSKNIICKSTVTDSSGNQVMSYMKAVITDNGYNEAILYFKESDKKQFETIFNKIKIS